jgi:hypothetical protein
MAVSVPHDAVTIGRCGMKRLKLAELTSGVGALVLGVGLGALFPQLFGDVAGAITVVGISLHAFGMWDKHRVEGRDQAENPLWVMVSYWGCWLLLPSVLATLGFWRR